MATSSLKKNFVIKSKKEASNFVKMLTASVNAPVLPPVVNIPTLTLDQIKEIFNDQRK